MTVGAFKKCLLGVVVAVVTVTIFLVLSRQQVARYDRKSSVDPFCKDCAEKASIDGSVINGKCEELMEKRGKRVISSDRGIQLLAATPGSGSGWSKVVIPAITGYKASTTSNGLAKHAFKIYYKTHYPFQNPTNARYLNTHQNRTMVLIRDPFDAGFSEYTRRSIKGSVAKKAHYPGKYGGIAMLSSKVYLAATQPVSPSEKFSEWITTYLKRWRKFHEYWLSTYTGNVQVILYQDLVDDISKFTEITNYFGYNATLTNERRTRLECFYQVSAKMNTRKRPHSEVADTAKKALRTFYVSQTHQVKTYVESLLKEKYKTAMIIRR